MDKSISTTYLKINSTSKSLTKNARQQILLKIIYGLGDYISLNNILSEYESILGVTGIDSGIIEQDLQELVANNEIKLSNNKFHLSTSKRRKISEVYAQSVSIEENIIETFFTPFFVGSRNIYKIKGFKWKMERPEFNSVIICHFS